MATINSFPINTKNLSEAPEIATITTGLAGKVNISQGSGNAGKFLVVGNDGNVTLMSLETWQGGSY